ncbi:MAG: FprA family A-type flavoprotein [bacterium]
MKGGFKAIKVTDHVYWVGAIDWAIRDFHGYQTNRGTTYNAYLILADKITLIDTVKAPFINELFSRISSVVKPEDIDYVVSNHSEMDHSGCIPATAGLIKPEKIFASKNGALALDGHYGMGDKITAVKDGETLDLGGANLTFVETKMIHWPDSMFTYMAEDGGVLFSQDGFSMHLASSERFADEICGDVVRWEAAKYYANILLPLSGRIADLLKKVDGMGLEIGAIAGDHGPIWRGDLDTIIGWYSEWAGRKLKKKAVVVFDTMWQSTAAMARAVCEGLTGEGVSVKVMPLGASHRSNVATELLDAGALIVGSPTLNNNMFPTVADCLTYIKGLKPGGLVGAAFGSYGWSGEAVKQVEEILKSMNVRLVGEGVRSRYVPDGEMLERCNQLGKAVAEELKATLSGE